MAGETVPKPVLDAAARLIDLPYGRRPTPAVVAALGRGMTVVDGIEFLSLQAAAAFEWFTGVPVDSEPLAQAARNV
jgi:shikimate 5-dehydrogenase